MTDHRSTCPQRLQPGIADFFHYVIRRKLPSRPTAIWPPHARDRCQVCKKTRHRSPLHQAPGPQALTARAGWHGERGRFGRSNLPFWHAKRLPLHPRTAAAGMANGRCKQMRQTEQGPGKPRQHPGEVTTRMQNE